MAATNKDTFSDLERHRLRLEESISKLRKSLQHWQIWEAEYEGLKEEILGLGSQTSNAKVEAVAEDFGGSIVTQKEIQELFEDKKGTTRSSKQVVDLLSKRIDYVQHNVKTIQKQLITAEEKFGALLVLQQPEVRNEQGLPVTEIREELDEDGNVIASTTSVPGEAGPQVIDALRKAGVKELDDLPKDLLKEDTTRREIQAGQESLRANTLSTQENIQRKASTHANHNRSSHYRKDGDQGQAINVVNGTDPQAVTRAMPPFEDNSTAAKGSPTENRTALPSQESTRDPSATKIKSKRPRKSVTFAEDTKEEPLVSSNRSVLGLPVQPQKKANSALGINGRIEDISESPDLATAIIPDNESSEDAQLRKEMLQYGLSEVGAVVAELALEESGSEISYSDIELEGEDSEDEYSNSVEDEEDEFGRSTRREVPDDYRREMRELEMKLNARSMENVGPRSGSLANGADDEMHGVKQIIVNDSGTGDPPKEKSNGAARKGVRFAQELDISSTPEARTEYMPHSEDDESAVPAINDAVIERRSHVAKPSSASSSSSPATQHKVSRFKSSRSQTDSATVDSRVPNATPPTPTRHNEMLSEHSPPLNGSMPLRSPAAGRTSSSPDPTAHQHPGVPQIRQPPEGPPGKTLSGDIIERPRTETKGTASEPEDLDGALLHQQVTTEYHQMRNRMIQREGGFKPREDEEIVPLTEEEGGSRKKISRFKAARLVGDAREEFSA
ncbi:MAG: hypothetical protein M1812_005936 [Candelaria pacifica]|nr:MAG: hypothetical protein M1812_005936 [Candelaria pacifica]